MVSKTTAWILLWLLKHTETDTNLKHTGGQIADRALYGSAPKAHFHHICHSLMVAYSICFPFWLSG